MYGVSVVIPYGRRGDWEHGLFSFCYRRWQACFSEFEIVPAGSRAEPFSRAGARNNGARASSGRVLIFADADTTFLDPAAVTLAVQRVVDRGAWVLPSAYIETSEAYTSRVLQTPEMHDQTFKRPPVDAIAGVRDSSPGGMCVMLRDAFEKVGGYDIGFRGWGYEDAAIRDAIDVLWQHHERAIEVMHLWHPRPPDSNGSHVNFRRNRMRWRAYARARTAGPKAMRSVLQRMERER